MKITLQCFGAFRPFGENITLSLPEKAVVSDIRAALLLRIKEKDNSFNKVGLIDSSRFATETDILPENTSLSDGMRIAIIPPVSGG